MLLVGTAAFGVEGMRLKTAKEVFKDSVAGDEAVLDFDQMPDQADMDFYAEATGLRQCGYGSLPTDAAWKALNNNMKKLPSNYCHHHEGASYFCFSGECHNLAVAGSGGCTFAEAVTGDRKTYCETTHVGNQTKIDDCKAGGQRTEEGWWWNMLPYDSGFGCWANGTYADDSCLGPYPSLSCNSRNKTLRVAAGLMPREFSTSYCFKQDDSDAGQCYDVMLDKEVCDYAVGIAGSDKLSNNYTYKGKKTMDGWHLGDQGYDYGIGCELSTLNPILRAAVNLFNGEALDAGGMSDSIENYLEPTRQLFMELYPIRHQLSGWENVKQRTGFKVDTRFLSNLNHTGAR